MINLVIDSNETHILSAIPEDFPTFQKKRLVCGDFAFYKDDDNLVAVVERKTLTDLDSSIVDGRFAEQRTSLLDLRAQDPQIVILYIIEGDLKETRFFSSQSKKRICGALENLAIEHVIGCLHTADVAETLEKLTNLKNKFTARFLGTASTVKTIPLSRKAKIHDNILACQLNVINGLSMGTAVSIAERYKSMSQLIGAWNESTKPEEMLMTVPCKRPIGRALALKVYQCHFGHL